MLSGHGWHRQSQDGSSQSQGNLILMTKTLDPLRKTKMAKLDYIESGGNVFADLGLSNPEVMLGEG